MLTVSGQARTYVIPGWVYKAIIRNKLNIIDITDFTKIKPILSNNDIASWIYLNQEYKLMKHELSYNSIESLFQPEISLAEYSHLASSNEIVNLVNSRLNVNVNTMIEEYQIITVNDLVFIILNEGFGTFIQSIDNIKRFIRDYLKGYYSVEKLSTVAHSPLYNLYVELL